MLLYSWVRLSVLDMCSLSCMLRFQQVNALKLAYNACKHALCVKGRMNVLIYLVSKGYGKLSFDFSDKMPGVSIF